MQPSPAQPESTAGGAPAGPAVPTTSAPAGDTVAGLLAGLDGLDRRPLTEHVEVFEQVHGRLQAALREIDNA